jgi:hypothetical protein
MADFAKLLEGVASVLWPVLIGVLIWRLWPSVHVVSSAEKRKFTLKLGGQELTMEEVSQQQQKLIEGLEAKVINIQRNTEQYANQPMRSRATPELYKFTGDDQGLQESRLSLAASIGKIIDSGLNEFSVPLIHQLIIAQHNGAWKYFITRALLPKHHEETDALYDYLSDKLIQAAPTRFHGEAAAALGVMKNNMHGRLDGLRTRETTAEAMPA